MIRSILAAALVFAATVASPVLADDTAASEAHITLSHVDFTDPAAVRRAYDDLKTQARYVCDVAATYDHDYDYRAEKVCETNAVTNAVREINQVQLSRIDDEANGRGTRLSMNAFVR